jgi:hypothetical protein
MPNETAIDGEIVALESGRPSFSALQNYQTATLIYYVFDVMILAGKDVMNEPLGVRRQLLQENVLAKLGEPIRESSELDASLSDLISSIKAHGLEGLVAKRHDSRDEPGQRSGAWQKMRVNRGQAPGTSTPSSSATSTVGSCCTPGAHAADSRNECRKVIRTVRVGGIQAAMSEMAQTDVISSARCTHCSALNTFPGMSSVEVFMCSECGEGVTIVTPVQ